MKKLILSIVFLSVSLVTFAQLITPFTSRYIVTQKGGIVFIGNTATGCGSGSTCTGGNCATAHAEVPPHGVGVDNDFVESYVDIDNDASTFMSSSDSLNLPTCSQITFAGLYWGAGGSTGDPNGSHWSTRNTIKIKLNNGSYQTLTADASYDNNTGYKSYHNFKNITNIVAAAGTKGRYTIANMPILNDNGNTTNRWGGWVIVIVYKNELMTLRNLTVFNGLTNVSAAHTTTDLSINGFLTPPTGPISLELGMVTYDGDRGVDNTCSSIYKGDSVLFKSAGGFVPIFDAIHPKNDVVNSTISNNGILNPFRNPSYGNTLGFDADIFVPNNSAKNYITNSATSATMRQKTGGETYLTQVVTTAIDVYEPDLHGGLSVLDLNGGDLMPGDTIEYTMIVKNIGSDPSNNSYIVDTLPQNVNYVPGSIRISAGPNAGSKTDAASDDQAEFDTTAQALTIRIGTGANAAIGGTVNNLPIGMDSTQVKFRAVVTTNCVILLCNNDILNKFWMYGTGNLSGNTFSTGSNGIIFDPNGCPVGGSANTLISAASCPGPAASYTGTRSTNGIACIGSSINLSVGTVSGATYSWAGPNGFTSTDQNPIITNATAAMSGTYTVTVISSPTCSFTTTLAVTVNNPPSPPTVANSLSVCVGNTINLTATTVSGMNYSWTGPNGFTSTSQNPVITNATLAMAGAYNLTITASAGGCTSAAATTNVIINPLPIAPLVGSNTGACAISTINLTAGTIAGATYSWTGPNGFVSTSQNPVIANTTTAMNGTYNLTVTDIHGCIANTSLTIAQPAPLNNTLTSATVVGGYNITCHGTATGSITNTVTGGVSPYTYAWTGTNSFVSTVQSPSGLNAGAYVVIVTDANGCTFTNTITLTEPTPLSNTLSGATVAGGYNITCHGAANASISNTVTGGVAPYTYAWTGSNSFTATTQNISGIGVGTYTVIITDANGCSTIVNSADITITEPPLLTSTISSPIVVGGYNITCHGAATGSINFTPAGGTLPYTYSWTGPGSFTSNAQNLTRRVVGTYHVTVTDANGCTTTNSITLTEPAVLTASASSPTVAGGYNITCNGSSTGAINLTVTGGATAYSYSWTGTSSFTSSSQNLTGLPVGSYNAVVTDANGCTANANITLTQPSALSNSLSSLTVAGGYNITCHGAANASITNNVTGGVAPFTYAWTGPNSFTTTTQNISGIGVGTYTVIITDANGCSTIVNSADITITEPPLLTSTISSPIVAGGYNITCQGAATGSINFTPSGGTTPYTYAWTGPGSFTSTAQNLIGRIVGTYHVTVTDANGCTATNTITLTEPAILTASASSPTVAGGYNITCNGSSTGAITLTVTGGATAYSYSWTGTGSYTSTSQNLTGLPAGSYNAVVTDANGCTANANITLTQPPILSNTLSGATVAGGYNITCHGATNASITNTVTGGVSPYTYVWTGPNSYTATTQNISGIGVGTYTVIITDANGCSTIVNSADITITEPALLTSVISSLTVAGGYNITCHGAATGSINFTPSGGTTPYTYSWTGPGSFTSTSQNLTGRVAGTYHVTVTDANGCSTTNTITLTEPAVLTASAASPTVAGGYNITCNGSSTGAINLTVTGGATAYSYSWTGTSSYISTSQNLTGLPVGNYNVVVTDANGCTANTTITLTQPALLNTTISSPAYAGGYNVTCSGSLNGAINLGVTGGTPSYSYAWTGPNSFASAVQNPTGLMSGVYHVTVTDANGCSTTNTITLTQAVVLSSTISSSTVAGGYNISCNGTSNGEINFNVNGGTTPYTYVWTGPNSYTSAAQSVRGIGAGTYHVTVTDANGCTTTNTITLTEPVLLTGSVSSPTVAGGYNITCNGSSTGAINLIVNGGTAAYSYSWTGPSIYTSINQNLTGLLVGNYQVIVTDANGCTATNTISLTEPALLATTVSSPTVAGGYNITCNGASTGSINLGVTGGTTAYSYAWTGPSSYTSATQNPTALVAGTYNVVVTDANGCISTNTISLTEPQVLGNLLSSLTVAGGYNITCNGATDGGINNMVTGGATPYSYLWTGPSSFTATTQNISGLGVGTYTVVVTDANGCSTIANSANITLTQPAVLTNSVSSPTVAGGYNITCNGLSNGSINTTVNGGTSAYSYSWIGAGSYSTNAQNPTGLTAGTYSVTISDANGCTSSNTITLTQPALLNASLVSPTFNGGYNVTCKGDNNGSINLTTAGGTAGFTYLWNGPSGFTSVNQNINGLAEGVYSVNVTDANSCTVNGSIILTQPVELSLVSVVSDYNGSSISCYGGNNGDINITVTGGTPIYSYRWNGPSGYTSIIEDINTLTAGNYHVIVTDLNGCTITGSYTLTQPPVLSSSVTTTPATCAAANGTVVLNINGGTRPFATSWSNGASSEDLNNVIGGVYTVLITDANGCTQHDTATVNQISIMTIGSVVSGTLCYGSTEGFINLTVNNGTAPFTYVWSTGASTSSISNIAAGSYSVTVTDGSGCVVSNSFDVVQAAQLQLTLTGSVYTGGVNISSYHGNDGTIELNAEGGVMPYIYNWSNNSNTQNQSNLPAGVYSVVVTDVIGCSTIGSITLKEPLALQLPTGFSPNGDGKNDLFVVHGLEVFPDNQLVIYNRWGNIVNSFSGYNNDWDGSSNTGATLPNGTYFVILTINGEDMVFKGYVDLRR